MYSDLTSIYHFGQCTNVQALEVQLRLYFIPYTGASNSVLIFILGSKGFTFFNISC